MKDIFSSLEEFLNAKKLQTLQGANQNSSSDETESSNNDLLCKKKRRLRFLAEIPIALHKLSFKRKRSKGKR